MSVERVALADGRSLEVAISGAVDGPLCVYHHGTPGSVQPLSFMADAAASRGLRLLTYNRAGYGASTRHLGRVVADVAGDMAEILDHVGADRCVTFGFSGGGPHALATAALLGDRVTAVASVGGVKPFTTLEDWTAGMGEDNVEEFALAMQGAGAMEEAMGEAIEQMHHASATDWIEILATLLDPGDLAILEGPHGPELASYLSAGLTSASGFVDDEASFARPWGFDLSTLAVPTSIWQGSEDLSVPESHGPALAGLVPGSELRPVAGAGHFALMTDRIGDIVEWLAQHL